ncbi:esterase 1 [Trametes coccinea BRFM310]|uniref:Carboxylic ester hydrolase n=1 Tax=Trametes coccinea (strain BRFM310) TaxID=1353009 RepID=A0A1Y2IP27_TRAC3|nr:esterase 1 [Trametes coccinea BRFM310]
MLLVLIAAAASFTITFCRGAPQVQLGNSILTGTQNTGQTEFFGGEFFQRIVIIVSIDIDDTGIPYAEPPIGQLRFAPPVLKTDPGVPTIDASKYGVSCPVGGQSDPNEDCLTINVLRPLGTSSGAGLPVMVWIYGGGFQAGDASQYDGTGFAIAGINRGTPIIYVNFNYRLGALGFPQGLEATSRGALNLGLKDMLTALDWVQQNIAAFGGNPSQVTLFGQSAGSVALANLFLNSNLESLAHAAIFESGAQSTLPMFPGSRRDRDWQNFVAAVPECSGVSSNDTFDCLREANVSTILDAQGAASGQADEQFPWAPVIDGEGGTIPDLPSKLLAAGKFSRLPFISGSNLDEGTQFVSTSLSSDEQLMQFLVNFIDPAETGSTPSAVQSAANSLLGLYPDDPSQGSPYGTGNNTFGLGSEYKRAAAIAGDIWFHSVRRAWNQAASEQGVPVFAYLFADPQAASNPAQGGEFHCLELGYVFGQPGSEPARTLSAVMKDYWISFATSLNPNDGKGNSRPTWTQYMPLNQVVMQLQGSNTTVIPDTYRAQQIAFINSEPATFNH